MSTKNQNGFTQEFNFTKNYEPKDKLGQFVKKSFVTLASTALWCHKKTNYRAMRHWIFKIVKVSMFAAIVFSAFNYFKTVKQENSKITLAEMVKKEANIKAVMPQNIRAIKAISKEDIAKTIDFIKATQENQEKRLSNFYWNGQYALSEDKYFDMKKVATEGMKVRSEMITYYTEQISMISKTYSAVQRGDTIFSQPEALEKVVYWHDAMQNNIKTNLDIVNKLLEEWEEKFINKEGFSKYLQKNQALISTTPAFN